MAETKKIKFHKWEKYLCDQNACILDLSKIYWDAAISPFFIELCLYITRPCETLLGSVSVAGWKTGNKATLSPTLNLTVKIGLTGLIG